MTPEKPDVPGALNQLTAVSAPMAAERGSLPTRHGQLDFARRTLIMGIINVTPDSFFDGGRRYDPEKAIADGVVMAASGADILDVGGESTRPGASVDIRGTRAGARAACGARLAPGGRHADFDRHVQVDGRARGPGCGRRYRQRRERAALRCGDGVDARRGEGAGDSDAHAGYATNHAS